MHVPDEAEILLVPGILTDRLPPFLNILQDLQLHARWSNRRSLRKPAHQLVEKLLGSDLKVKGVTAVLNAAIKELQKWSMATISYCFHIEMATYRQR